MNYQSIIIIGAPRSGTNMLRDILCEFNGVGTWPCDEINYIWRHGNMSLETDQFDKSMVTPKIKKYINKKFDQLAKKNNLDFVIEKTCANSLRVPFVDHIVSNAKYIFIYRDGIDAAGSAKKRWTAELDIPYILKKVRYVPLSDLPYYGIRYFWHRIYKLFSKEKRLALWGPQFNGLDEALKKYSLEEVGALQWKKCVDLSEEAFGNISEDRLVRVKYEEFVTNPQVELKKILEKFKIDYTDKEIEEYTKSVSNKSLGKGRKAFNQDQTENITELIKDSLERYGYE
ncbi:sulfotransferase [Sulfurimonas lithotrophica]|uniref:Sulfotransferase n=1 Tax=Sulfurimonas lithotrophica TaxID=2590022 RepID=A0A5P8NZV1_9BACT|nr:sulfotransferase [Sulfurimonas lithotrophica]QFR48901.1 sulfotransferase [Sulfurimonas lithotrophica]